MSRILVVGSANVDFTVALSRLPTPAERAQWSGTDEEYLKDLFWALLNSKEFGTNH